ncbi:MAG TPA: THUMP domain-containing class I SAM-dependent methyltransferase [Candidatus Binataceae bacterium]|nr:THUMP domain-containing class I SAM-dependent methyltransferase [Candidatus Binataceae bacterium]
MRRPPNSGWGGDSPPANDSRTASGRRVRRDRPKGPARGAKPYPSAKPVRFEKSAKSGRFEKPVDFPKSSKSDKRKKPDGFDKSAKPAHFAKSDRHDKRARFDRRAKPAKLAPSAEFAKPAKFAKFARPDGFTERPAATPAGPTLRLTSNIYIAHTQPGFEGVAAEEIAARYVAAAGGRAGGGPAMRELGRRLVPERAGMIIFSAPRPDPLGVARTLEDLFALVGYRDGLGTAVATLEKVRTAAHEAPFVDEALEARVRMTPGSRAGRKLGFRVIARIAGEHEFRRLDFQRAVERGIADRGDHSWRGAGDDADVEFWATLLGGEMFLAVRLVDERMRHREYKVAHRPGSLRASVAAALGWLSQPGADDCVVDPMCGAGTILIERAHIGRYAMLAGFDRDPDAIAAAHENIGPRYRPIGLAEGDALRLPLGKGAATHLVTNLPWGTKYGSHGENRRLYPRLVEEFARVVRPGGRLVMLTAERMLMREVANRGFVRVESVKRVMILGAPAVIYLCRA